METIFDDRGLIISQDDTSVLIISDLHLGVEEELAETRGVQFPPQHPVILERIAKLVEKHDVSRLYIIGDVKRWAAKRRQTLVLQIRRGRSTAMEPAR